MYPLGTPWVPPVRLRVRGRAHPAAGEGLACARAHRGGAAVAWGVARVRVPAPPPAGAADPAAAVVAGVAGERERAAALARRLALPLLEPAAARGWPGPLLWFPGERLELRPGVLAGDPAERAHDPGADVGLWVDPAPLAGVRRGRDDLLRAVRLPDVARPELVDATAGLGQDAFALAAAGCRVRMLERSPLLWALLDDALARARERPDTREAAARLHLERADATARLAELAAERAPAVVYLDPMYPEGGRRARGRARQNRAMRLFRALLGDDADADELLAAARAAARRKVVVKRPRKAPFLGPTPPSGAIEGRTTRYDLYPPAP